MATLGQNYSFFSTYKIQISVKHTNFIIQLHLRQNITSHIWTRLHTIPGSTQLIQKLYKQHNEGHTFYERTSIYKNKIIYQ